MRRGWHTFKSFWMAEEVPRWFGLSVVLIYLSGLGAVAYLGIDAVREQAIQRLAQHERYAVVMLADRLGSLAMVDHEASKPVGVFQRELFEFAAALSARYARIVDRQRRVIGSTQTAEIGTVAPEEVAGLPWPGAVDARILVDTGRDLRDRYLRAPFQARRAGPLTQTAPAVDSPATAHGLPVEEAFCLEVRLPSGLGNASGLALHANTSVVVLIVLGALFVLYRCLRTQLRSSSRIVGRLQSHRERIEHNLESLRVSDAVDGVTAAWNELVDLAQRLSETVRREAANDELTRVLMRSGGGALAEALNALPDGLAYVVEEGRFEYLNATALRLLGWSAEKGKKTTLTEAQAEGVGDKILAVLRAALQPDGSFEARSEIVEAEDENGAERSSYRIWIIPLHRAHHRGECVLIVRDVSQQVRADRAREEFVTQVTHELRTPLTNIRAYAETLASGMFEDPKVITECYNVITKETRRLSRLIEDILSVSQMEVGSIELHVNDADVKTLLSEGVRDVRGLADEKEIDIQVILPAKLETIRVDRDKIAVVINNLLGNAIKYTPRNGNVVVGCQFTTDAVVLSVKDNGIGIDPKDQARVFEKFQRADDPAVQAETGTGIGLYTAREIIRRHGGNIELISEKGAGSTFMVKLPRRESRASTLTKTTAAEA